MAVDFEQNLSGWTESRLSYRYGLILILPPEPIRSLVNSLRAEHDPISHACCDAHISLTMPLPTEIDDEHWNEFEAVASSIRPFLTSYGPLANSLPHPGVVLAVEPQGEIDQLRAKIESCSAFLGAVPRPYPFWAHMTIAEFISVERTKELMIDLHDAPSGAFMCDCVSHVVPDSNFRFVERRKLFFRG